MDLGFPLLINPLSAAKKKKNLTRSCAGLKYHWRRLTGREMEEDIFIQESFEKENQPEYNSKTSLKNQSFILKCGTHSYEVNKNQLQAKSPYFEALFNSCMKESLSNEVEFNDDFDEKAFKIVFEFVESSKYPELGSIEKNVLFNVLALSHLFIMTDLFEHVTKFVSSLVTLDEFFEIWDLAKMYNNEVLTTEVIAFVAKNCKELKDDILPHLEYREMELLLLSPNLNLNSPSIIDLIIQWMKIDSQQRNNYMSSLLLAADLKTMTTDDLEMVLKEEQLFVQSKHLTNCLLESFSLSRLKIIFFTGKKLYIYFWRENTWQTFDFPKFYEPFWNGTVLGTQVLIFAGNFKNESVISNVLVFNWKNGLFEKHKVATVESSLENSTIALLNGKNYFLQICETDDLRYDNTIFTYDSCKHCLESVAEITTLFKPSYLVPVDSCLFLFDKRAKHFGVFHKYHIEDKKWSLVPYPEFEEEYYEEKAVCCDKKLYLIRYGKVAATLFWDYKDPKPDSALRQMESKGSVQMRYLQSGIKYVAFCVKKILYEYVPEGNDWLKMETVEGPENINTILNSPDDFHCRIPFICVIGSDGWLYSLTPNNCKWKKLTDLHPIHFHDYRRLLFLMGC